MGIARDTWIVIALALANLAITQLQGDPKDYPLDPLWRVIVIPVALLAIQLISNQLKSIGQSH